MKKPVHILMYLAMGIMMMHSMVPHHHSESEGLYLEQENHSEAFSLIHFLEDLFDIDLGDDHLENFQTGRSFDGITSLLFVQPGSSSFSTESPSLELRQNFVIPRSFLCCLAPNKSTFSLRAPPHQV